MAATTVDKPQPAAPGRGQQVWAILLVLDAFFVIIFGGALSAKLYQHWHAPAVVASPAPRARRDHKAAAAKPAETAAALASKPIEAPPPEVPSAAKPPQPPAAVPAAKAPGYNAAPKAKAIATSFSIMAPGANSVELVGAFIVRGGKKAMVSHQDGTWTLTLYLTPDTYRYWFTVNGKKKLDPQNPRTDRGASVISVQP